MTQLKLTGLDAQNPLAYLAALGLLRILDGHASSSGLERPRLGFVDEGRQVPALSTTLDLDAVTGVVLEDAARQADNVALRLAYDEEGNLVAPETAGAVRDLKPAPGAARAFLERCAGADRRASDLAAGFFSELVQDRTKGRTKPTALHFTAGQQAFLDMVESLRTGMTPADLREALEGPWLNSSTLPSLSWDASVSRLYALRASDPSKEKRGSVPGAYWLAVQALAFFPVVVARGRLSTTGVSGGWKDGTFTWPLWTPALTVPTVASVLKANAARWTSRERAAMGVSAVLRSRILRSDQGGYGSFTPAEVVVPPRRA